MADQADNISAGTQVVSRVEVRGTNDSIVHPRGAVGVVTRTPTAPGEKFLVHFPDGFEFSLERDQLEVLKHFKARLGAAADVSRRISLSGSEDSQRVPAGEGGLLPQYVNDRPYAGSAWRQRRYRHCARRFEMQGSAREGTVDEIHLSESGARKAARLWAEALDANFFRASTPWLPVPK
jgi:hypothetical protein